jgi:hypothetical protein
VVAKNILEEFFDKKELAILKLFLFDEIDKFYLKEVSKKARVPGATTFRIVNKFKEIGIVDETKIKKTKLYSLARNKNTVTLSELFEEKKTILDEFVDFASEIKEIEMIIAHGEDVKDKVNVIIIGTGIDQKIIKEKVGEIKDRYNFSIIELILEPGQFNQMSSMGLFPSKKTIIWERPSTKALV